MSGEVTAGDAPEEQTDPVTEINAGNWSSAW